MNCRFQQGSILTAETIDSARRMYLSGADYVIIPRFISAHYVADILEKSRAGDLPAIRNRAAALIGQRFEDLVQQVCGPLHSLQARIFLAVVVIQAHRAKFFVVGDDQLNWVLRPLGSANRLLQHVFGVSVAVDCHQLGARA